MSGKMCALLAASACAFLSSCSKTQVKEGTKAQTTPRQTRPYMVQGPWEIGDPVHEVLTLLSLRSAIEKHRSAGNLLEGVSLANLPPWDSETAYNLNVGKVDKSLHQFLRGAFWPDDPEGLFFNNKRDVSSFSIGLKWNSAFGRNPSNPENITARSHFGDLQYVHAMSPLTSLPREDVHRKVLEWAEFLVEVAAGRIEPSRSLNAIPSVSGRFPNRSTVSDLLVAEPAAPESHIRQRAAGTLLHLIQDSYSPGHAKRSGDGVIVAFHCYNDPDHDRNEHVLYDRWADGATLKERVQNTPGAAVAVEKGARLLALLNARTPRAEVLGFLRTEVFNTAPPGR